MGPYEPMPLGYEPCITLDVAEYGAETLRLLPEPGNVSPFA